MLFEAPSLECAEAGRGASASSKKKLKRKGKFSHGVLYPTLCVNFQHRATSEVFPVGFGALEVSPNVFACPGAVFFPFLFFFFFFFFFISLLAAQRCQPSLQHG